MTRLMGIVNVTPDSFSGDGRADAACAIEHAIAQIEQGAHILDIGGESTRPGAAPVSAEEEKRRILPVIQAVAKAYPQIGISIDTMKVDVAAAALQAGATILNDISGAQADPDMARLAAQTGASLVLMHNQAKSVEGNAYRGADYNGDVVAEVCAELNLLADRARACGVARDRIILDPGIGFGKSVQDNLRLIAATDRIRALGYPVLIAPSRKSFIGAVLGGEPSDRLEGTAACVAMACARGADYVRVHDVAFMARIVKMITALKTA